MTAHTTPEALIQQLGLEPHPEGGNYRETYRAREQAVPYTQPPRPTKKEGDSPGVAAPR